MTLPWIIIGCLVVVALLVLVGVWRKARRRGMSNMGRQKVEAALRGALAHDDRFRRILAVDAVLDTALTEVGFSGSLGEKLKAAGPRLPQLQAVWDAHKLRNRLAHEHDASVAAAEIDRAVAALVRAIRHLAS